MNESKRYVANECTYILIKYVNDITVPNHKKKKKKLQLITIFSILRLLSPPTFNNIMCYMISYWHFLTKPAVS